MSLRKILGGDAARVHEQVDALLDSEDAVIVLADRSRAISYAHGFGISPCQLELLMLEIERTVRNLGGPRTSRKNRRTQGEERQNSDNSGRGVGVRRHRDSADRGHSARAADRRGDSLRIGRSADGDSGIAVCRLLRMATHTAATDALIDGDQTSV